MTLFSKILEERHSKYNGDIRVIKILGLGTSIQANGLTQSGGIVEVFWKQTLKKIRNRKLKMNKFLILGLGGGTLVKLIKKFWPESKITGVDIDRQMVDLGEKYLNLNNKSVDIKIQDALTFSPKGYDCVIVDVYNGDEFPKEFEDEKFLRRLTKNKVVIFNRLYYGSKRPAAVKFGKKLEKIFSNVEWFYPEANLMFICYLTPFPF
jgi:spermidine synthase